MTAIVTGMYIFAGFRDKLVAVEADGNESGAETIKSALASVDGRGITGLNSGRINTVRVPSGALRTI